MPTSSYTRISCYKRVYSNVYRCQTKSELRGTKGSEGSIETSRENDLRVEEGSNDGLGFSLGGKEGSDRSLIRYTASYSCQVSHNAILAR